MKDTTHPANEAALVMFSGGQDSTTCLAWALDRFERVETIGFDYGQRHAIELDCRSPIRAAIGGLKDWESRLGLDHTIDLTSALSGVGATAMTSDIEFASSAQGLPNTFVPGRNLMFLVAAAGVAWRRGIKHLVGGMCETDYSGYPDCRDDAVKSMQVALNLGMENRFVVHTPLMWLSKAATWALADGIGGHLLTDAIVELTHTCYLGDRGHRHDWGYGCGVCPACELRASGWMRWRGRNAPASSMGCVGVAGNP